VLPLLDEPLRVAQPFQQGRIADTGDGLALEGWLVTYGEVNRNGWLLVPGAFKRSVAKIPSADRPLPMLSDHDRAVGRWVQTRDSIEGVWGKGRISDTPRGQEVATLLKDEAINGISIGFDPDWALLVLAQPDEEIELSTPYGPFSFTATEWTIVFPKADLLEASIVSVPADDDARVDRLLQRACSNAARAMPGLRESPEWEDAAYSMALLMGGRGAGRAFEDVDEVQRISFYTKLAGHYSELGKTPPPYERQPIYREVAFAHDEREIFADRYLRKSLAAVVAGAGGFQGPLSRETREEAERAVKALTDLARQSTEPDRLADVVGALTARVREIPTSREA